MAVQNTAMRPLLWFVLPLVLLRPTAEQTRPQSTSNADWLRKAKYGVFMHFLPSDATMLARVQAFDVEALASQLEAVGAGYFVLTLGQNSGYFNAPNSEYDRVTGYAPGERCSKRDLPADLATALRARGIRLLLYLPCQVPNEDRRSQAAFGLPQGRKDQPIDLQSGGRPAASHADGRLHGGRIERALSGQSGLAVDGWITVARADVPGHELGAAQHQVSGSALG
jgi:hypothetical protein